MPVTWPIPRIDRLCALLSLATALGCNRSLDAIPCDCETTGEDGFAVAVKAVDGSVSTFTFSDVDPQAGIPGKAPSRFWDLPGSDVSPSIGLAPDGSLYALTPEFAYWVRDTDGDGIGDDVVERAHETTPVSGPAVDADGVAWWLVDDGDVRLIGWDGGSVQETWTDAERELGSESFSLSTAGVGGGFLVGDPGASTIWLLREGDLSRFLELDDTGTTPGRSLSHRTERATVWVGGSAQVGSVFWASPDEGAPGEPEMIYDASSGGCSGPLNVGVGLLGEGMLSADYCGNTVVWTNPDEEAGAVVYAHEGQGGIVALSGPADSCSGRCL